MSYTIREALAEDFADIYVLNRDEMGYDYPPEETRKKLEAVILSQSDKIFVAVCEDKVIGYIHVNDYDVIYAPHMKNVMGIAVGREYKRMGVGSALIAKAEEWAKETGASGIRLVSGESREIAHKFYRSQGYVGEKKQINFKKIF